MFATTYRTGGVNIRCEFDSQLSPSLGAFSELYRIDHDEEAALCCRFHIVDIRSLDSTVHEEVVSADRVVGAGPEVLASPVLRSPLVRSSLRSAVAGGDAVRVLIHDTSVTILDFSRGQVEYFALSRVDVTVVAGFGLMETAPFLPALGSAAVHGLGLVRDGSAALFLAPDDGGKTTVASLRPGGVVLSDDQVILSLEGAKLMAHSTPWGRMGVGPTNEPLGAFFLLEKADVFELAPIRPTAIVEYLWQEGLVHYQMLPRAQKIEALDLLRAFSRKAPAYRMRFPRDHVDWGAVDAAMAAR